MLGYAGWWCRKVTPSRARAKRVGVVSSETKSARIPSQTMRTTCDAWPAAKPSRPSKTTTKHVNKFLIPRIGKYSKPAPPAQAKARDNSATNGASSGRLDLDLVPLDLGAVELGDDAVGVFGHDVHKEMPPA